MTRAPTPDHIRRTAVADYYRGEQTAAQVAARYGIPRSTFGAWVKKPNPLELTGGRWVPTGRGTVKWEAA